MSKLSTFIREGYWYKGNLHAHSSLSDGELTPQQLVDEYTKKGYHFLAITDHWLYSTHNQLQSDNFLLFGGVEFNTVANDGGCEYHTVAIGNPNENIFPEGYQFPEFGINTNVNELIKYMNKKGHFCIIAHPYWSRRNISEIANLSECLGIEVYNYICDLEYGCGCSNVYWDHLLWGQYRLFAFAADDTHIAESCANVFIKVKAAKLSYEDIFDSIKSGSFYASTGPDIYDFYVENNTAYVDCSPCNHISFHGNNFSGVSIFSDSDSLTHAECKIEAAQYIYVTIKTKNGCKAWTQPIWVDAASN